MLKAEDRYENEASFGNGQVIFFISGVKLSPVYAMRNDRYGDFYAALTQSDFIMSGRYANGIEFVDFRYPVRGNPGRLPNRI